ncbi:MAG: glycosyltransferase [Chlamydiae bacterium]|nr:glycosyltransferase [Chlamydiota bacterium]
MSPLRGGPSATVRTVTRGLIEEGLDVHVVTTDDDGFGRLTIPHGFPIEEEGVVYWYFPRQTYFYTFSWPLSLWLGLHVRDYHVIHIHALFSYASVVAAFWCARYGIPYVVRPLGTLNRWGMLNRRPRLKKLSFRFIERRVLSAASAIHYTSEQERFEAGELGVLRGGVIIPEAADPRSLKKSVVIPNAVDFDTTPAGYVGGRFRASHPEFSKSKLILFLSRLDPKKGLDLLLPAFARVKEQCSDILLILAGDGEPSYVAWLKKEVIRLGIAKDVLWTGFLFGEEKWTVLADADIFVLPSYSENFGVACVEAMAFGIPVIVSDQVGIYREVLKAEAGVAVRCDVHDLSQVLIRLLGDASLRLRLGENGRRLAHEAFSVRSVTKRLIELYNGIALPVRQL